MFQIQNISKAYGKRQILKDVSLTVNDGEAVGILGVNGSGKSTFLSSVAAMYANNPEVSIGYIPQENPLLDELKPVDNIKLWSKASKASILEALSSEPLCHLGINSFIDTPVKKMSGGMKKRLSLATVLIDKPKLLLMDEPFAALDLTAKHDILGFMGLHLRQGGSIIVASHDEDIFRFCNRVFLLKNGIRYDTAEFQAKGISYVDILRSE